MRKKLYAFIISALAASVIAPSMAMTAFAEPEDEAEEVESEEIVEESEEVEETEPPAEQTDTKPFNADAFLESHTTVTTYDYYGDPYYDTDGNASLISDRHVIYSSDQIQFISVATKDGHVFYIVIDYTDTDGDNVYFLNKVDDFDLYRLMNEGKEDDEEPNIAEEYVAQQGDITTAVSGNNQKQGSGKSNTTTITEPADNQSSGGNFELLLYIGGGVVFVLVIVLVFIIKYRSVKKNRIPTDDFDDDDYDDDITGDSGEYDIK